MHPALTDYDLRSIVVGVEKAAAHYSRRDEDIKCGKCGAWLTRVSG
jgi:hypothetical protein